MPQGAAGSQNMMRHFGQKEPQSNTHALQLAASTPLLPCSPPPPVKKVILPQGEKDKQYKRDMCPYCCITVHSWYNSKSKGGRTRRNDGGARNPAWCVLEKILNPTKSMIRQQTFTTVVSFLNNGAGNACNAYASSNRAEVCRRSTHLTEQATTESISAAKSTEVSTNYCNSEMELVYQGRIQKDKHWPRPPSQINITNT